ncbi:MULTISPECIES: RepA leader peptide Tap [Yersinia]|nr:RepA leader peptide Tap [Yersinia enterocolitica]
MRCLPGTRKAKTPKIFSSWRKERLSGPTSNCIEAVALYGEYMCMPRKVQYLLCLLLLPCNISAGRCD